MFNPFIGWWPASSFIPIITCSTFVELTSPPKLSNVIPDNGTKARPTWESDVWDEDVQDGVDLLLHLCPGLHLLRANRDHHQPAHHWPQNSHFGRVYRPADSQPWQLWRPFKSSIPPRTFRSSWLWEQPRALYCTLACNRAEPTTNQLPQGIESKSEFGPFLLLIFSSKDSQSPVTPQLSAIQPVHADLPEPAAHPPQPRGKPTGFEWAEHQRLHQEHPRPRLARIERSWRQHLFRRLDSEERERRVQWQCCLRGRSSTGKDRGVERRRRDQREEFCQKRRRIERVASQQKRRNHGILEKVRYCLMSVCALFGPYSTEIKCVPCISKLTIINRFGAHTSLCLKSDIVN